MILSVTHEGRRVTRALGFAGILCGLAAVLSAGAADAQNLVKDPGFESSTSSSASPDWTLTAGNGTSFYDDRVQGGANAHTGDWSALFEAVNASQADSGTLSQTIATMPNTTYVVSFFLANQGGPHDTFLATFGGQTVLSLTDASAFSYTKYSATITTSGKSSNSVLAFTAEQDASDFHLDDISVVAEGAPAPAVGGGLLSFAVALIGAAIHRTRKTSAARRQAA